MFCVMNKYISIGECVSKGDNELMGNAEVDKLDAKVRIFINSAKHFVDFFIKKTFLLHKICRNMSSANLYLR